MKLDWEEGDESDARLVARVEDEVELRLVDVQREPPDLLQAGDDERALPDDDLEPEAGLLLLGALVGARTRDDERLVRLGDLEEEHCSPFPRFSNG